jgi:hypothetical protein
VWDICRYIFRLQEVCLQLTTETGGLVVIGMFLLQWNTSESIERFEEVAGRTFGKRRTLLARALQLVVAYIEDGQYSLAAVQNAFSRTFNSPVQMFNPLESDTKVAVTTTTVDNAKPRLFTNYNGGQRPQGIGMSDLYEDAYVLTK